MNRYEVTYQQENETCSAVIEASGPVDAERKILAEKPAGSVQVLCVIRL
jgi:hypothetical protein